MSMSLLKTLFNRSLSYWVELCVNLNWLFFEINLADGHIRYVRCWAKIAATCLENIPLGGDDSLDQDAEEEEERLVHGGEVDADVEREEEHELDQEAGVDQHVGHPGADSDGDAGGAGPVQRVREAEGRAEQQAWI